MKYAKYVRVMCMGDNAPIRVIVCESHIANARLWKSGYDYPVYEQGVPCEYCEVNNEVKNEWSDEPTLVEKRWHLTG